MASSSPPRSTARHPGRSPPVPHAPPLRLRPARQADAARLTELAIRAKAHWGYDAKFLDACRPELAVLPEHIRDPSRRVSVAELERRTVGFSMLALGSGDTAELGGLFVEPAWSGRGIGRVLLDEILRRAREHGRRVLRVESDPGAEGFYLKAGARPAGHAPSGSIAGRQLPVLTFPLRGPAGP